MRNIDLGLVPRIGMQEARDQLDQHRAIFVDVRSEEQYRSGHIVGAVPLPLSHIAAEGSTLPRDRVLVTY